MDILTIFSTVICFSCLILASLGQDQTECVEKLAKIHRKCLYTWRPYYPEDLIYFRKTLSFTDVCRDRVKYGDDFACKTYYTTISDQCVLSLNDVWANKTKAAVNKLCDKMPAMCAFCPRCLGNSQQCENCHNKLCGEIPELDARCMKDVTVRIVDCIHDKTVAKHTTSEYVCQAHRLLNECAIRYIFCREDAHKLMVEVFKLFTPDYSKSQGAGMYTTGDLVVLLTGVILAIYHSTLTEGWKL